jgi:SAM-dependent MidA family methyltransferase
MRDALYGDGGFYRSSGAPGRNFRTSAHVSAGWAAAVAELAARVDRDLGSPDGFAVVDVGAGGGELLAGMAAVAPASWRLLGVDVAPRPDGLPDRVEWAAELPGSTTGLLVAVEWLDVVPVDQVELTDAGPRLVEVATDGGERLGAEPDRAGLAWLARWWPMAEPGDRAEVGLPRDHAWAEAVARLRRGVAVAVDYAAVPGRDVAGTLTGFRDGRQVPPVPDRSMDLTAHVLLESCAAAAAVDGTRWLSQREALRLLRVSAARPAYGGDPGDYLRRLGEAGDAAELLDPSGLGGFSWLVQVKGCPDPFADIGPTPGR